MKFNISKIINKVFQILMVIGLLTEGFFVCRYDAVTMKEVSVIMIGDSYGQMSFGGVRDGQTVDDHQRNDGDANVWTGRLAGNLELSDTLVDSIKSPKTNCKINIYEDNLLYSAGGRGFISYVNDTDYQTMIEELPQYIDASKVRLVILGGGANDSKWPNTEKLERMTKELVETAHSLYPNAKIVIAQLGWGKYAEGTLPDEYVNNPNWYDKIQKGAVQIAEDLERICQMYDYVLYVGNVGKDALSGHEDEYFTGYNSPDTTLYDPIHPNYLGEQALADQIYKKLIESDISYLCEDCLGHNWSQWEMVREKTCLESGIEKRICSRCQKEDTKEESATGHNWSRWNHDEDSITHTHICLNDNSHTETEPCVFHETARGNGTITYTCSVCNYSYTETLQSIIDGITRICGVNRFSTNSAIISVYRESRNNTKENAIILASSRDFPDALSGSYVAYYLDAPVVIIEEGRNTVIEQIREMLEKDGTIYVLGGEAAVTDGCLSDLKDSEFNIKRLSGDNRYLTNIEILKYVSENDNEKINRLIVATGKDFADSLSVSSTGLPLLLVNDNGLYDYQIDFLNMYLDDAEIIIVGGTKAVNKQIEDQLKQYGKVKRIYGDNREKTSVEIAKLFFPDTHSAILVYSRNYPDALCGGPLAQFYGIPVLLTNDVNSKVTKEYCSTNGINRGYALGGEKVLPDSVVEEVFGNKIKTVIER
jgi:putative cell wall-binding protein/lysophospholipase L1-like esterase